MPLRSGLKTNIEHFCNQKEQSENQIQVKQPYKHFFKGNLTHFFILNNLKSTFYLVNLKDTISFSDSNLFENCYQNQIVVMNKNLTKYYPC